MLGTAARSGEGAQRARQKSENANDTAAQRFCWHAKEQHALLQEHELEESERLLAEGAHERGRRCACNVQGATVAAGSDRLGLGGRNTGVRSAVSHASQAGVRGVLSPDCAPTSKSAPVNRWRSRSCSASRQPCRRRATRPPLDGANRRCGGQSWMRRARPGARDQGTYDQDAGLGKVALLKEDGGGWLHQRAHQPKGGLP